jgi:hypothetical protein
MVSRRLKEAQPVTTLTVVTRNVRHFAGFGVGIIFNPWKLP